MDTTETKKLVGFKAVDELVQSGMKLGLGTGSTAVWAVRRVGELLASGSLNSILAVPTSSQTEIECQKWNIPLRTLNDPEIDGELDLVIDGADEVDPLFRLTKGGGGALLIEKVVAYASKKVAIVVDESKLVKNLGLNFPIPTEVMRIARVPVMKALEALGATVTVRMAVKKMGPVITDNGNILLDILFKEPIDPYVYEEKLNSIPGLVENGLFTRIVPEVFVGYADGRVEKLVPESFGISKNN